MLCMCITRGFVCNCTRLVEKAFRWCEKVLMVNSVFAEFTFSVFITLTRDYYFMLMCRSSDDI